MQLRKYTNTANFQVSSRVSLSLSLPRFLAISFWLYSSLASTCRVLHFVLKKLIVSRKFLLKSSKPTFHSLFMRRYSLSLKSCAKNKTRNMKVVSGFAQYTLSPSPSRFSFFSPPLREWPILVVLKSRWWRWASLLVLDGFCFGICVWIWVNTQKSSTALKC